jgi:hypothetical protein
MLKKITKTNADDQQVGAAENRKIGNKTREECEIVLHYRVINGQRKLLEYKWEITNPNNRAFDARVVNTIQPVYFHGLFKSTIQVCKLQHVIIFNFTTKNGNNN